MACFERNQAVDCADELRAPRSIRMNDDLKPPQLASMKAAASGIGLVLGVFAFQGIACSFHQVFNNTDSEQYKFLLVMAYNVITLVVVPLGFLTYLERLVSTILYAVAPTGWDEAALAKLLAITKCRIGAGIFSATLATMFTLLGRSFFALTEWFVHPFVLLSFFGPYFLFHIADRVVEEGNQEQQRNEESNFNCDHFLFTGTSIHFNGHLVGSPS
jgi:hypothetical protein